MAGETVHAGTATWWGRRLVQKKLRLDAAAAGQAPPPVTDVDFLVGVSDHSRQGNLGYAEPGTGEFLVSGATVPKLVALPDLLAAADRVAADDDPETAAALKTLLDAGSTTLGGARPKASVEDEGRLLIAKFPHQDDEWDVMAWEKTALDLAERCGIEVPERRLVDVGGRHVLMLTRFDRAAERLGYISVRTLSEARSSAGNDYLDMVAAIEDHSANAVSDLRATWHRIAFTVAANNTDDHFRNHGFLRTRGGWTLAPAFDINIDPRLERGRATSLAGADRREASLRALVHGAAYFGMAEDEATAGLHRIAEVLEDWRAVARSNDVPDRELDHVGLVLDDYRARVGAAGHG
ncbi:type II toxin-antitoxin system HipA family toxin [Nocardioides caeni]|uniref:type II toxin-antitoxin system HipA family toxin n=1 Tax=Nocardioides caeni TaxID=574700 RepID=UPI00130532A0|nr:HipA domain-containing protein [Nocardioides caeni]